METPNKIQLTFPNAGSLPFKYYEDERYNQWRRRKIMLFGEYLSQISATNILAEENRIRREQVCSYLKNANFPHAYIQCICDYVCPKITAIFIAERIERGCMNRTIVKSRDYNIRAIWANNEFRNLYHSICYKISMNLDSKSIVGSDFLLMQIQQGKMALDDIANLSGKQLCPEKYEKLDKKINQRVNQEIKVKYSTLYKCFRCKNNKCTSERVYNRSLDEGVNLRITCTVCYNEWGA